MSETGSIPSSGVSGQYDPNIDFRIIGTAEDAILAKHATAQAKYYKDPFCHIFCEKALLRQQRPRYFQPLIKRGTHARVCCMDRALTAFLKAAVQRGNTAVEIIVLGAGKDTSYWRLVTNSLMGMEEYQKDPRKRSALPKVHWKEVDHPSVVREKAEMIQKSNILSQCCPNLEPSSLGFSSQEGNYHLIGADLRASSVDLLQKLSIRSSRPTLILVECVFMYLPYETTKDILQEFSKTCPRVWIACYEPILQNDAFGKVMEENLVVKAQVATMDCGLLQTRTLDAHLRLLSESGYTKVVGCDMDTAYQTIVNQDQRKAANKAEFLDELEEWSLIMRHYSFVVATTCSDDEDKSSLTQVGPGSPLGFLPGRCHVSGPE